jgi:oligopeptide transport system ATP-binding protein
MERIGILLDLVGLRERDANLYPHEFSGGQRQRISIARALGPDPELIVLDEPLSALDVSIRSQIMNLLKRLQKTFNMSYLLIPHDLGVVEHMSNWVAAMYLGKMVELAKGNQLYSRPRHPCSQALIPSTATVMPSRMRKEVVLTGDIPSPLAIPHGCCLHTRCPYASRLCSKEAPKFEEMEPDDWVACHHIVD